MPMRNRGINELTIGDPNGKHVVISKNPLGVFVYDNPATLRASMSPDSGNLLLNLLLSGSTFSSATADATPQARFADPGALNSIPGKLLAYFTGRGTIGEVLHVILKAPAMQDFVSGVARAANKLGYLQFDVGVDGTSQDITTLSPGSGNLLRLGTTTNSVEIDDGASGQVRVPYTLVHVNGNKTHVIDSISGADQVCLPAFNTSMTVGHDGGTQSATVPVGGNGVVTYTHGLRQTPNSVLVISNDTGGYIPRLTAISSTGFSIQWRTNVGAVVADGVTVTCRWGAWA